MAVVALQAIRKSFGGRPVLAGIDIALAQGELVSLLGPSGCGKTTLLRILAGFERPDAGTVRLDGRDITALAANRRNMGMVFQSYSLFPNLDATDNVRFGPRVRGVPRAEQSRRAEHLLELVGLGGHRHKFPHQLSGGQQQRVALARALAVQPDVLLLDEPLSALDAKVRAQLRSEIRRIQRETGVTTVFVTHDQEEALSISDRVAVMNEGRMLQVASPAAIYREPADAFVARFIGAGAVLSGRADGPAVRVGAVALPAAAAAGHPAGTAVELFLRPEHVRLDPAATPPSGALAAEIRELTFFGSLTRVRLALDGIADSEAWADVASDRADGFQPGLRVWASWDAAAPRVLARV
ncbi:MAG: spermidine/putrescine ABC transporter ATP-binding protein [Acetobacteraceae bacterium SCN 69-10]|nr:ABC transporter ATP-binding protein [Rhodospirillales bacterium]ODU62092.1 MAG: spermidine/putrescine ABC transporter ATP-binding protein [Acetobacteraceae bacterium SCN 69-10]OJY65826.1 MAG: spermidine/putrescine ABC transporter ATP-binding protein [Rhodospirillales bacterium 70-18]